MSKEIVPSITLGKKEELLDEIARLRFQLENALIENYNLKKENASYKKKEKIKK